jgi:hypothetical protein
VVSGIECCDAGSRKGGKVLLGLATRGAVARSIAPVSAAELPAALDDLRMLGVSR